MDMRLTDGDGRSLRVSYADTELLQYVYRPDGPQVNDGSQLASRFVTVAAGGIGCW